MFSNAFSVLSLSSLFIPATDAMMIPLRRSAPNAWPVSASVAAQVDQGSYGFTNVRADYGYTAMIYVQGQPFQVILDTGSSDLWVQTTGLTLDGLFNTTIVDLEQYGTSADYTFETGYVELANVTFGPYTVNNQAMMNAVAGNTTQPGMQGVIGISAPNLSLVAGMLENTSYASNSKPFLINLFELDSDIEPYYAIQLSRSNGSQSPIEGGSFAVGEVVEEWAAVLKAPQILIESDSRWMVFIDGIRVGDKWVDGGHNNDSLPLLRQPASTQSVVLLDTGTTYVPANPYFVDAVYKGISGASFVDGVDAYQIPCDTKLNVSVTVGGMSYPIDPMDMVTEQANANGSVSCYGTWQYAPDAGQDLILGDVFLRNVYTLFNLGNWTANHDYQPFVQLLSITDQDQALANYDRLHNARIAEVEAIARTNFTPSTVSLVGGQTETWALSTATSSPTATAAAHLSADLAAADTEGSSGTAVNTDALVRNEYIIMGMLGGAIVLLLAILARVVQNGRNKQYRQVPSTFFSGKPYGG